MEDEELSQLIAGTAKSAAERVRDERRRRGWSQETLASHMKLLGVDWHQTTVAKVESPTRPRVLTLTESVALAAVFGWPRLDWLVSADLVTALREYWTREQIKSARTVIDNARDVLRETNVAPGREQEVVQTLQRELEQGMLSVAAETDAEVANGQRLQRLFMRVDQVSEDLAQLEGEA